MPPTKTSAALDATQEIAQNTLVEGATADVSTAYDALIQIWYALTNATAHTGTRIRVQHSTATSGDEDWADLAVLIVGIGTTNLENITNNPAAAGTTVLTCASTTGYAAGAWIFLEDVSVFADSEWCFVKSITANTNVTVADGTARQHAVNSIMNSVAGCCVPIMVPASTQRVRICYDNTYDADGATVAVKSNIVQMTAY